LLHPWVYRHLRSIGSTREGDRNLAPKAQLSRTRARRASPALGRVQMVVLLAALAVLLAVLSGPTAWAQSGGVPGPDVSPVAPAPEPDPAPGPDSDRVEASPPPETRAPAPTTPAPTDATPAPAAPIVPASPSAPPVVESQISPPTRRAASRRSKRVRQRKAARRARIARETEARASVEPPRPRSVFGDDLALSRATGRNADTDSPPGQLIAFALLTLVLASASFLVLTARLSREWRV
jgi:hypothetical protein